MGNFWVGDSSLNIWLQSWRRGSRPLELLVLILLNSKPPSEPTHNDPSSFMSLWPLTFVKKDHCVRWFHVHLSPVEWMDQLACDLPQDVFSVTQGSAGIVELIKPFYTLTFVTDSVMRNLNLSDMFRWLAYYWIHSSHIEWPSLAFPFYDKTSCLKPSSAPLSHKILLRTYLSVTLSCPASEFHCGSSGTHEP